MRIAVFGAAGNVGTRTVAEALSRGHNVTAVVRDRARFTRLPEGAAPRIGDAADPRSVADLSAGHDVVISAVRPAPGDEYDQAAATKSLLEGVSRSKVRILIVGGAATLRVPGTAGTIALDDPRYVGAAWRNVAEASAEQHRACQADTEADWVYLSPPATLEPGGRTGSFRLGGDELLVDAAGVSRISMEDLAVALIDEAEVPKHHRSRFTVAY